LEKRTSWALKDLNNFEYMTVRVQLKLSKQKCTKQQKFVWTFWVHRPRLVWSNRLTASWFTRATKQCKKSYATDKYLFERE